MKAHIIENGVIVNTVRVKSIEDGMIEATSGSIGWRVIDGVITPPSPEYVAEQERKKTLDALASTDATMLRVIDDIYAVLTESQKESLPTLAKEKLQKRAELRGKL